MAEHTPAPTPARSLYGFFIYLFSKTCLILYCIWTIVPDYYFHSLNVYYYPQKYWSTAVPIQCLVALTLFAFIIYPSSNLMLTSNIDNNSTITDLLAPNDVTNEVNVAFVNQCICQEERKCLKHCHPLNTKENMVPQLQDLNIRFVCKKLYLNRHT